MLICLDSTGQALNVKVRTGVVSKNRKDCLSVCPDLLAQCNLQLQKRCCSFGSCQALHFLV